ncbi:MAG: hypothetical protein ACXADW_18665 [Candidatus Hodarchaeales archaeon]|jgi:hypothetical protein
MSQLILTLVLDSTYESYYKYLSREEKEGYKIVNGVYILKDKIGEDLPKEMTLSLEW